MNNHLETFIIELNSGSVIDDNYRWEYDNTPTPVNMGEWFVTNGQCFERNDNEKGIIEAIEISKKTNNQCFQNTQLIALDNKGIKYYEGLVYGTKYKMTFHHGFNVIDNKAIDVTDYFNKTFKKDKDSNWCKEEEILYYGIHIPNEFLASFIDKLKAPYAHNPLIFEYYETLIKTLN